ncbi:MAG: response regulator transcription factor [Xanthomonadaceae bacterium]|nr:response regulator transcription factor [Xanthomonadaceae bacterium]
MRLLLVEDERALGEGICAALSADGYTVDWLTDGERASHALKTEHFDLLLLDLGLPRKSGLEVLREFRRTGPPTPVLIVTAQDAVEDRVQGLDAGADDYITKPFDVNELKARIRATLRRSQGRAQPLIEYAGITLDTAAQTVRYQEQNVILTRHEYMLLHELLASPGKVLTRERLMQALYGWEEEAESNVLEVHIHHLRKKLAGDLIRTVRGVGYVLREIA